MVGIKILSRVQNNNRLNRIKHIPTMIHTVFNSARFRDLLTKENSKLKKLDQFVATQNILHNLQSGVDGKFEVLIVPWYSWRRFVRPDHQIYINVKLFDTLTYKDVCMKILAEYLTKLENIPSEIKIPTMHCFRKCFEFTFENHAV